MFNTARFEERWRAGETTDEGAERPALEDLITLRQQLDDLADSEQRLLHMRFWEGLSIGEIAERLGEKYSTISVRLFRLLKRLEAALGP